MMLVRWRQDAVSSEPPAKLAETGSKPMKIYYEDGALPGHGSSPVGACPGAVSELSHMEAPESLGEAVRLPRASRCQRLQILPWMVLARG